MTSAFPASLRRIISTFTRFVKILFRSNSRKFELLYDPVVLLVTWGLFFVTFRDSPAAVVFFSSSILWHLSYSFQSCFNLITLEDIWNDCFKELLIVPLRLWEYLLSKALASLVRNFFKVLIMLFLASAFFGYGVFLSSPAPYIFILLELFILATSVALMIDAAILVAGRDAQPLAWSANSLVIMFACPYYPKEVLPAILQPIAQASPYFVPFQQMKSLVSGGSIGENPFSALIPIVAYLSLSLALFSLSIMRAKKDGSLARF